MSSDPIYKLEEDETWRDYLLKKFVAACGDSCSNWQQIYTWIDYFNNGWIFLCDRHSKQFKDQFFHSNYSDNIKPVKQIIIKSFFKVAVDK